MSIILKLNVFLLVVGFGLGILCLYLDRQLLQKYESSKDKSPYFYEQTYLMAIKSLTTIFFAELSVIAFSGVVFAIHLIPVILTLPAEVYVGLLAALAIIAIGGVAAVPIALRKTLAKAKHYILITPADEPDLYKLSLELAHRFNYYPVDNIHITPGAEIQIAEDVNSLDDIFYGGNKTIKIGLSSLQFLMAADLKVLLARQYAYYGGSDRSLGIIIHRLNKRLRMITDNLFKAGFLLAINPVFWFAYIGQKAVSYISKGYSLAAELKTDEAAAAYYGANRLKKALARYNVETQRYKTIIEAASSSYYSGQQSLENIYSIMKSSFRRSNAEIGEMVDHLFNEPDDTHHEGTRRSLKLRLKRLPETAESEFEINYPAFGYLSNWLNTEYRMMQILNNEVEG